MIYANLENIIRNNPNVSMNLASNSKINKQPIQINKKCKIYLNFITDLLKSILR